MGKNKKYSRTIDILIPVYNEDLKILKTLLDSIAIQQNVDMKKVGVIICGDGGSTVVPDAFLEQYPFHAEFHMCEHAGVSATRNKCFDYSNAKYVCWCDADDMFYNACGLWIIFREIESGGFDSLVSAFIEETRIGDSKEITYINHNMDSTFVHGKFHRTKYLINKNIRWNDKLTIHEDSYFNCLCQNLSDKVKYCSTPFYLWRWRDDSVCRHDPKYILKTYNNMLDSNTALVNQFIERKNQEKAQYFAVMMIYDAYFTMNKDEWLNQENQEYRNAVEKRFKKYYNEFKQLFDSCPEETKNQIIVGLKNRMFGEGLMLEAITFNQWIKHIEAL